jgi:uncharacterized protein YgbK (DUF1537 family)
VSRQPRDAGGAPYLGAVADDLTGATDLANNLTERGFATLIQVGRPDGPAAQWAGQDAVVVALTSRTAPTERAVADSLASITALRAAGCRRFYVKYCSTFDSTNRGNIGPIVDAALAELGAGHTLVCPAFPATGRTVYLGHLFVGDRLLAESPMRHHPLTPMTDSDVRRLLAAQTGQVPADIGLIALPTVRAGEKAVRRAIDDLAAAGVRHIVTDAVEDADLRTLAAAGAELPLLTGGSGLALGMTGPRLGAAAGTTRPIQVCDGPSVILSGSASAATRRQVAHARTALACHKLPLAGLRDDFAGTVAETVRRVRADWSDGPVLVYSVESPDDVAGPDAASLVERSLAACARALADQGARRFVVAGGETSGAVLGALAVRTLTVGPPIDPGVAWCTGHAADATYNFALKSGNFGGDTFFTRAWDAL